MCLLSIFNAAGMPERRRGDLRRESSISFIARRPFFLPPLPIGFLAFLPTLSSSSVGAALPKRRVLSCTGSPAAAGLAAGAGLPTFFASATLAAAAASAAKRAASSTLNRASASILALASAAALRRAPMAARRCNSGSA